MSVNLTQIPYSTLIILLVSAAMAFASTLINSHFTPKEHRAKLKELQQQINALNRERRDNLKKAKDTGDKKLLKKAQKQEKDLLQLQSQMSSMSLRQMRAMPVTMIMFFVVWMFITGKILYWPVMNGLFTGEETVAYLQWTDGTMPLNLFYWYFLCSILFGTFAAHIFGLGMTTDK